MAGRKDYVYLKTSEWMTQRVATRDVLIEYDDVGMSKVYLLVWLTLLDVALFN